MYYNQTASESVREDNSKVRLGKVILTMRNEDVHLFPLQVKIRVSYQEKCVIHKLSLSWQAYFGKGRPKLVTTCKQASNKLSCPLFESGRNLH